MNLKGVKYLAANQSKRSGIKWTTKDRETLAQERFQEKKERKGGRYILKPGKITEHRSMGVGKDNLEELTTTRFDCRR